MNKEIVKDTPPHKFTVLSIATTKMYKGEYSAYLEDLREVFDILYFHE